MREENKTDVYEFFGAMPIDCIHLSDSVFRRSWDGILSNPQRPQVRETQTFA